MRDENFRESSNIEDRRGGDDNSGFSGGNLGGGLGGLGGLLGLLPIRAGGGLGVVVVILLMLFFGGGKELLSGLSSSQGESQGYSQNGYQQSGSAQGIDDANNKDAAEARTAKRVARVLGSTEDYWTNYFKANDETYVPPKLVLFNNRTTSACGSASAATGPFYCPGDGKVYLDMGFFDEMQRSLGANGDFAEAYVIAHEIGHRVQDQLGILGQTNKAMARSGQSKGADSLQVRVELQADCFAGAWAKNAVADTNSLEQGDIEEAMNAAQAVGDDRLQKKAQGYAVPDSFTHGTSAQRAKWFDIGMKSGDPASCDTFKAGNL